MPQRSLSNAWKKNAWMRLLSGLTLEPSMASRGVEEWIASLGATRVSLSPQQVSERVLTMTDTSGLTSEGLSQKSDLTHASSRTSADIFRWDLKKSTMTFKQWTTRLRQDCSRQQESVLTTSVSDSSSMQKWPTPAATDWKGQYTKETVGRRMEESTRGVRLPEQPARVTWFGTPTAHPRTHSPRPVHHGVQLANQVGGKLNPPWVEWLMGWPINWTALEPVGTGWSLWLQRMRGQLSILLSEMNEQAITF